MDSDGAEIAFDLEDVVEARDGLGLVLLPRAEAAGPDHLDPIHVPVTNLIAANLVRIPVQRQLHAQLLQVSDETQVLHLVVGRGHRVMPNGDAQWIGTFCQAAFRDGHIDLPSCLVDGMGH